MFTRSLAEEMLDEVLRLHSELDDAECKSGAGDALKRAVCAASNRRDRNGGVLFVGVNPSFQIVGVSDIEKMQEDITSWAADAFNTPLRVAIEIFEREGKNLLAVIVPSCPAGSRPCCFKNKGPYEGSWIRANNSTRLMTQDEVRREIAGDEIARGTVAPFDRIPYLQAPLEALDTSLIQSYVELVKKNRSNSQIENVPREKMLYDIKAIAPYEGTYYPTPTGLMFFCREPHQYLPQITVEFLHLWGPELTSLGPDGSRWRFNKEIFGTLPQIIDEVENLLLERIPTRGFIDSFRRRDEPEYPRFALREAVVNAVAHRDYSLRGSHIQIRLYPDSLEIDTPGGLYPPVTVDNIEDEKSTRNESIVAILQEFGYMERRGYGFNGIIAAMREAGLAPPLVKDNSASFGLCLRSHVLMSPEALVWLRQFDGFTLSPQERLALVYLRVNDRLYNRDYVRLAQCTSTQATIALRGLTQKGILEMNNTRGGAYYTLSTKIPTPAQMPLTEIPTNDTERILALARTEESISVKFCATKLSLPERKVHYLITKLVKEHILRAHGRTRSRYYTLI